MFQETLEKLMECYQKLEETVWLNDLPTVERDAMYALLELCEKITEELHDGDLNLPDDEDKDEDDEDEDDEGDAEEW